MSSKPVSRRTRPRVSALVFAFLVLSPAAERAAAHAVAVETVSDAIEALAGTVLSVRIDNTARHQSLVYRRLRLTDGTAVALLGDATEGLPNGSSVRVSGRRRGTALDALSAEVVSSAAPAAPVDLDGVLKIAHADDFTTGSSHFAYEVQDDAGDVTPLNVAGLPSDVRGGSRVHISGKRSADGVSVDPDTITVEAEPSGNSTVSSGLVAKAGTINSVLVIMANFNNTTAPAFTQSQAQLVMTSNANSVANFYSEVSYGGQSLNVTVTSAWVNMNLAATCSYTSIASAANTAAQALSSAYNASNYNFVVYLFPQQACGWSGLAYVGSPHQAFINGTGAFTTQVIAHEMGHNFGLYHAGSLSCGSATIGGTCTVAEYGDPWDTMGNARAMHFNAAQKLGLGWIGAATVKTHSSGSANYTLSPLETGGAATYAVQIPTSNTSRTYWLEFRQPIGFDAPLSAYPNNGVQVRVSDPFEWASGADDTEILDMTPGSAGGFGDSALVAGQSYLDSTTGVNIIVTSATSSAVTVSVTKGGTASTSTSLASSTNPSTAGLSVTFTATVTGSSPTGTVSFKDGATSISGCSAVALAGSGNTRTAQCATSALTAGTHSIVASYSGDAGNAASSSATLSQTVNGATSTTGLATSLTPSTVGASVTFTATVSGVSPTGSVNFKDGSTSIGGCSAAVLAGSGNIRTASCATAALAVGSHSVTAAYSGDASNSASTSGALTQTVNKSATSTTLGSSVNPAVVGASVTFTASVTGYNPTGTVNFTDAGVSISGCSAVAVAGSGNTRTAQCSTSALAAGTHGIVASYGGDGNNVSSSSTALSQAINSSGSSTAIATSLTPSTVGTSVTFSATVSGVSPTGTVNFKDGSTSIGGCSAVSLAGSGNSRTAACATAALAAGSHSITAAYSGDASNGASTSSALTQTVNKATSNTALASSINPSTFGASVTFTATITGYSPTGTVNFKDAGVSISGCSAAALAGSGNTRTAQCSTSTLAAGTHSIVASYSGDTNNAASSSTTLSQAVNSSGSSTGVATSLTPSTVGTSVTFTATVNGSSPTGTINFKDGSTSIGGCTAVSLSGSGNTRTAACATAALATGSHGITAAYSGDASNGASTSSALTQTVDKSATSTTLGSSANPSAVGASVTFTGSVTGYNPTGSVNFTDGGVSIAGCGAVALSGSGSTRTAQCTSSALTAGTHSIAASYGGDGNNASSVSSTLSQSVQASAPPAPPPALVNPGFETPALPAGGYQYDPTAAGIGWTFVGNSGIQRNGSAFAAAAAPEGTQTAFVQSTGSISQSVSLAAGTYTLSFMAAQRACCVSPYVQPVMVTVDGTQIGALISPSTTSFAAFSIVFSVAASGGHTIAFAGTDPADKTTFIDAVTLASGIVVTSSSTLGSSLNPSKLNASVTFTATVTGSNPSGQVAFTVSGKTIAGCGAVALSGSGDSKTAKCTTTFVKRGTYSIVATYGGDANNSKSSGALSQSVKRR